jgi:hypothetical protein
MQRTHKSGGVVSSAQIFKATVMNEVFPKNEIKELLKSLQVAEDDNNIDRLSQGLPSDVIKNVRIDEDEYKDGKIKLFKDDKGVLKMDFDSFEPHLEFPEEILGHKLEEEEIERLKEHKPVVLSTDFGLIGIQVDEDLNKVTVLGQTKLEHLEEIGGYNLSEREQAHLFNGGKLTPKVLYDKVTDSYIQAELSLTSDGKGIEFSHDKSLTKEEAQELIKRFNKDQFNEKVIAPIANIGANAIEPNQKEAVQSTAPKTIKEEAIFMIGQNEPDIKGLLDLAASKAEELKKEIDFVFESQEYKSLSSSNKTAVNVALKTSPALEHEKRTGNAMEIATAISKGKQPQKSKSSRIRKNIFRSIC